jgi:hypothetical protein
VHGGGDRFHAFVVKLAERGGQNQRIVHR